MLTIEFDKKIELNEDILLNYPSIRNFLKYLRFIELTNKANFNEEELLKIKKDIDNNLRDVAIKEIENVKNSC